MIYKLFNSFLICAGLFWGGILITILGISFTGQPLEVEIHGKNIIGFYPRNKQEVQEAIDKCNEMTDNVRILIEENKDVVAFKG